MRRARSANLRILFIKEQPVLNTPMQTAGSISPTIASSSAEAKNNLRSLSAEKIIETVGLLVQRINERFPAAGLGVVAAELHRISADARVRAERIRRPDWRLRFGIGLLLIVIVAVLVEVFSNLEFDRNIFQVEQFMQLVDSSLASMVLIGAAIAFLVTLEVRLKRGRALKAIRELRSLAHIVDMHQLTKDPERSSGRSPPTISSPKRVMTLKELGRYLDYCSELLSLIGKIGALYVQDFPDTVALEAVDQLSTLTNALSRNIWQKIIILESMLEPVNTAAASAVANGPLGAPAMTPAKEPA
jgi:hypothetical protein